MFPRRSFSSRRPIAIFGNVLMMFLVWIASGCQSHAIEPETATPTQTVTVTASIQPSPTFSIKQERPVEWMAWESGSHSSVEGLECNTCHEVKNGQLVVEPAWYDQRTSGYVSIEDTSELCEKCHTDTQKLDVGDKTYAGFSCTTCHDPHSLTASCTSPECHSSLDHLNPSAKPFSHPTTSGACIQAGCHVMTGIPTAITPSTEENIIWNHQDGNHKIVTCVACHDGSNLEVGVLDGENIWVTFRFVELNGVTSKEYFASHNIQREVNCARCHYPGNPWGLMEISPAN